MVKVKGHKNLTTFSICNWTYSTKLHQFLISNFQLSSRHTDTHGYI